MNDTTRGELLTQVKTYLADFQDTTGYDNHDMNALGDTYAQSIIALVTEARDAEIRRALLEAADGYIVAKGQDGEAEVAFATKPWMEQILDHIGLHGDGTGAQG